MSGFLNIASIFLGLVAWAIPLALVLRRQSGRGGIMASGTACSAALLLQLGEIAHRAAIDDYSAIADTIGAIVVAGVVLVAVTAVLNLAAVLIRTK